MSEENGFRNLSVVCSFGKGINLICLLEILCYIRLLDSSIGVETERSISFQVS
jgi:hypothetical protein